MTLSMPKRSSTGGDDAGTQYFRRASSAQLTEKFKPIVAAETAKLGLTAKYNDTAGKAAQLGLLSSEDANLNDYVTSKALDGLFSRIAEEEHEIRKNPLGQASSLIRGCSARFEASRLSCAVAALRIVQRFQPHRRGTHLAKDVDLEARALARERGRQVAGGEAPADAMAVGARGHVADRRAVLHDRLVADHLGVGVRHSMTTKRRFGPRRVRPVPPRDR